MSRRILLPVSPILAPALILALACCDDQVAVDPDVEEEDVCGIIDCEEDTDVEEVEEEVEDEVEEVVDPNQCDLEWSFKRPEGGVPSHPLVSDEDVTTITAGSTLRRLGPTGTDIADCSTPFSLPGEMLGTPSQDGNGRFWMGTSSGKLVRVNRKCGLVDEAIDIEAACAKAACNDLIADGTPHPVRQAPAMGGDAVYVLDEQPVLHKFSSDGDHLGFFISTDEDRRGAAPVFVTPPGGQEAFAAFPTRQSVVAVKASNHAGLWTWDDLDTEADPPWEITTPLAVTSEGKLVFVAAETVGDTHQDHKLYRLTPAGSPPNGQVDDGFPIALDFPLDTFHGLVIGADESIYAATRSHGVAKFDPDGNEVWRFIGQEESLRVTTVPTLGDDGALYFTAEPHFVYGVDKDGKPIFRHEATGELESTGPAIRSDGAVIVHFGTEVMAWRCPTAGLATSSWPRYQRNNRNSGNLSELQ